MKLQIFELDKFVVVFKGLSKKTQVHVERFVFYKLRKTFSTGYSCTWKFRTCSQIQKAHTFISMHTSIYNDIFASKIITHVLMLVSFKVDCLVYIYERNELQMLFAKFIFHILIHKTWISNEIFKWPPPHPTHRLSVLFI